MKRALLIAGGTIGGLGAVLSITPPQLNTTSMAGLAGTTAPTNMPASANTSSMASSNSSGQQNSTSSTAAQSTSTSSTSSTSTTKAATQKVAKKSSAAKSANSTAKSSAKAASNSSTNATTSSNGASGNSNSSTTNSNSSATNSNSSASVTASTPTPSSTPTKTVEPAPTKSAAPTPVEPTTQGVNGDFTGTTVNVGYGNVQVRITVKNGKITDAQALQAPNGRNDRFTNYAVPILRQQTLAAQSSKIQGASGASYTSWGWYTSLQAALVKAGM